MSADRPSRRALRRPETQDDLRRMREDDPFFAGTLAKGLMLLQAFVREPRPQANSELAARLGMPRSTVSRLCRSLQALGYLDHDARLDRYFIGPAAVALGYPYLIQVPLLPVLRPAMQALADRVEGAVSVGVALGLDVVYVETCAHGSGTLLRPGVGAVRGILESAMGRAWLAQADARERQAFWAQARRERPQEWARCAVEARASVAAHAARGFAVNLGDAGLGVWAVGAASRVRHGQRRLLFNCAVSGLQMRESRLLDELGPALVQLVALADRQPGQA